MASINSVTQKEKAYLEDALQMENLCITKYSVYMDQCQDREIKNLLSDIARNKRQHVDTLKQVLSGQVSSYQYQ
ncbi:Hypothetical protein LUCI_3563 [Lucifera butyrica]|uniref:Spore coat protein n=1 Tax=Lucifera butyrica TaxID=1351585 RepID=A0A498RDT4_9FIRM|nr:ferritin-like domain-containing protein [Lucifera butyrica]VBB08292.1 Hypothetical protein LUCI_3563 [Lucifera butyrica]